MGNLSRGAVERLIVQTACRRHEDGPVDAVGMVVGELADDGAAHGVADQGRRRDLAIVEEPGCGMGEVGNVERTQGPSAVSEPRQVGHEGVEVIGQAFGCRQQVPAGETETVQVHHHRSVGRRMRRFAIEHVDAVDSGPVLGQGRGRSPRKAWWSAPGRVSRARLRRRRASTEPGDRESPPRGCQRSSGGAGVAVGRAVGDVVHLDLLSEWERKTV